MSRIHNPQNEKGKALATDEKVDNVKNTIMVQIDELLARIKNLENTISNPPEELPPPTIEFTDLDDTTGAILGSFKDLTKINFRGKYVNISPDANDEITVYINEDNNLAGWNGNINMSPAIENRFIYGVPSGSNRKGNTEYPDVASTEGIHDLTFSYNGKTFSLPNSDYSFIISYKINNISQPDITIPLSNYISSNKIETSENFTINNENLNINGKKLGNNVLSEGKISGSLEINKFTYVLKSSYLNEGLISDIKISFVNSTGNKYEITSPKSIYFWTSTTPSKATGKLTLTPNFNNYVKVSGLQYVDSENSNNKIALKLDLSNLANGALLSNTITLNQSGFVVTNLPLLTLNQETKIHSTSFNKDLILDKQNINKSLTVSANIPNPSDSDTIISAQTNSYPFYATSINKSTDLIENFNTENKRLTSNWSTWNSNTQLSAGEAVVQYGKLFHTNTTNNNWKDAGANGTLANYKNLTSSDCKFYRIFKDTNNKSTTNTFYISGIDNFLGQESKVEIIVQPHNGTSWSQSQYIANKISTPSNNGLASSTLVNGKIKCDLPLGNGTYCAEGLRVQIIIKDTSVALPPISISFS